MEVLYESVLAKLKADDVLVAPGTLASMLHTISHGDDPRIYKTSVQAHTMAVQTDIRWVTVNKETDAPEPIEQTQSIRRITFAVHVWAREDTSEVAEAILQRCKYLLNLTNLATANMLAWFCRWVADSPPLFEEETLTWHLVGHYETMVCAVVDLP